MVFKLGRKCNRATPSLNRLLDRSCRPISPPPRPPPPLLLGLFSDSYVENPYIASAGLFPVNFGSGTLYSKVVPFGIALEFVKTGMLTTVFAGPFSSTETETETFRVDWVMLHLEVSGDPETHQYGTANPTVSRSRGMSVFGPRWHFHKIVGRFVAHLQDGGHRYKNQLALIVFRVCHDVLRPLRYNESNIGRRQVILIRALQGAPNLRGDTMSSDSSPGKERRRRKRKRMMTKRKNRTARTRGKG
eukprot:1740773-Pyramimonas_sp.AAC.2